MNKTAQPLRVLYAAGPGNVLGTYKHWLNCEDDPSQLSVTYSSQFYDACHSLGAKGYVISSCAEKTVFEDEHFKIEHRPSAAQGTAGIRYHLNHVWYGLRLVASALRWRADVAVVADGTTHWFVLAILPYLGVKVIPSIHCGLWNKYTAQRKTDKLLLGLSHRLFSNSFRILAVSSAIGEQVNQLMSKHPPILEFRPLYRQTEFDAVLPPADRSPFRVLFAGRIEVNKGVFDLLEIAKRFAAAGRTDIHFDLCGAGSMLEPLKQAAIDANLTHFVCHGYCNKPEMRQRLSQSHVVIAPTTTAFEEGFCKVVAEGVLAGRPVVTSTVCPVLSYVKPAVVEVQPDDVQGYGDALLKLCDDRAFYQQKQRASLAVQDQFYDGSRSWETALRFSLLAVRGIKPSKLALSDRLSVQ